MKQPHLPSGGVNVLDGQLRVINENVLHRRLRAYLKHVAIILVVVCLLGSCYAAGRCGKRPSDSLSCVPRLLAQPLTLELAGIKISHSSDFDRACRYYDQTP